MLDSGSKTRSNIPSCSICKCQYDSYYRIPRVIPKCGHTFCQKCINSNVQVRANRKMFICTQCQAETIIRKSAAEDIPKNIGILDIVRNLKKRQFEQASPMSVKSAGNQPPTKVRLTCKQHPNKQLDLICQTCKYQKICSICVLIGNSHQDHKFVEHIPASNFDLNEVKQVYAIVDESVKLTILPSSQYNILKKAEQNLVNQLGSSVKNHFKEHYYKVIEKKQNQVLAQVREIRFQGSISNKIEEIAKHYDMLKTQYSELFAHTQNKQNASLQVVEQFIQKCKNLHNQIEVFSLHTQKQSKTLLTDISTKINQSSFFRISELPFSLKLLVAQKVQLLSPSKQKAQGNINQIKKNRTSMQFNLKQSRSSQRPSLKQQQDVKSVENISFDGERKPFTANSFNTKTKSSFLPPKHRINKSQAKMQKKQVDAMLDLNSKLNQKKTCTSQKKPSVNTERLNKSSVLNIQQKKNSVQKVNSNLNLSQFQKIDYLNDSVAVGYQLKIKQVRPSKQIPLNLKAKFSAILKQIKRQEQSQSLQLIGMDINDALIIYICDYLKTKKLKFSMIKLVKNNLSDEGLSILFGHLLNEDRTQVLNLTSNQLTSKCLDLIVDLGNRNSFLKTIYLSHNKISSFNVKQKIKELESIGMEIII